MMVPNTDDFISYLPSVSFLPPLHHVFLATNQETHVPSLICLLILLMPPRIFKPLSV